jgi:NADH dehydrogenase
MAHRRVIIVGGGFGGLAVAKALRRQPARILLVDRRNHHVFQPLLYQVAGAALAPGDIAEPIRAILGRQDNVEVLLGEVTGVDLAARTITVDGATTRAYDTLVLAAGMVNHWYGNEGWDVHAPGLKTLDDALEIRRRILLSYERAEWCEDEAERRALLTFVVVGGGPTGVELAGALKEIGAQTMRRDFRHIHPEQARVILVEGTSAVLQAFGGHLPAEARAQLEHLGVEVRTDTRVSAIDARGVTLGDDRIDAATVLWAAGVRAAAVGAQLGVPLDRSGRVVVEPDLSVPGHPEVMVIGDLAHFSHQTETGLPGVAQVALQMGKHVARNLAADAKGRPRKPFRYRDLGSMATVGRKLAVAEIGGLRFAGFIAWLIWLFVHLIALVGFRNRFVVLTQWSWNYFTNERNSRLIRGGDSRPD